MCISGALIVLVAAAAAVDVRPTVTSVIDRRSTGQFPGALEVEFKLIGDDAASIRAIRTTIGSAIDDAGRSLLPDEVADRRFELVQEGVGPRSVTLRLKNPARKATVIKEVTGELQLFVPGRDPGATVLVPGFMKGGGSPVAEPVLARAGVAVTFLTKKQYESLKREGEKQAKDAQKQGVPQAMMRAMEGFVGAFWQVGENDLVFKIADPAANLVAIDVVDVKGTRVHNYGTFRSHDFVVLSYQAAVPADGRLRVSLKTERSVVSVPLRLVDVVLP